MIFEKVFVERSLLENQDANKILAHFTTEQVTIIEDYDEYFGTLKKPYLNKRTNFNLYLAKKKGALVKQAPDAYGLNNGPHYYFIHTYNCIYECDYCFLQGYFDSPDMVLFLNRDEVANEIITTAEKFKSENVWFHAGEFSDSLALSHISGEVDFYYTTFKNCPNATLELRTKSVNIREILKRPPLTNIIVSFSMSPKLSAKNHDLKTPPISNRIKAMKKLSVAGHKVAIHFDPIIYASDVINDYKGLIDEIASEVSLDKIEYLSLGVVRFTKKAFFESKKNYPQSKIFAYDLIKGKDDFYRYPRPIRAHLLSKIKDMLLLRGMEPNKIYFCMEDN